MESPPKPLVEIDIQLTIIENDIDMAQEFHTITRIEELEDLFDDLKDCYFSG